MRVRVACTRGRGVSLFFTERLRAEAARDHVDPEPETRARNQNAHASGVNPNRTACAHVRVREEE
jgi:hypothetical protein